MSRYTLELRYLVNDKNFNLFDFDYNLFDNDLKPHFEKLFINYFYFNEIGFETIGRFKFELKNKLDMLYPYYKEYYKTVKQVEIEDFMQTKDLKETFLRTLEGENLTISNSKQNNKNDLLSKNINKFSDTPRNTIQTLDTHFSQATIDDNNQQVNGESVENANVENSNKVIEKTEFESKGDLGVSSSGLLIQGWRDVITNIYQLMFDDMEELFMGIY